KLSTNLLPGEIRLERLVRAKKPWAVAAAGLLLLGLGASAFGNYLNERPFKAAEVTKAMKDSGSVADRANANQAAFEKAKSDAQKEEEALKAIVAGQFERLNWVRLLKFISEAVPQPDAGLRKPEQPGSLPPEVVQRYWEHKPDPRESPRPKGIRYLSGK